MANEPIATAIGEVMQHARMHARQEPVRDLVPSASFPPLMNQAEAAARAEAVESICIEMEKLAQRPDSNFREFDALRRKLETYTALPPGLRDAVADAFIAAGRLDRK